MPKIINLSRGTIARTIAPLLDINKNFEEVFEGETIYYSSGDNLIYWQRDGFPAPIDLSNRKSASSIVYDPVISSTDVNQALIGINSYPAIKASNNVVTEIASNDLAFTNGITDSVFTVSFWFKYTSISGIPFKVIDSLRDGVSGYALFFSPTTRNFIIQFKNTGGTQTATFELEHEFPINQWHHVVISYTSTNNHKRKTHLKCTVNGQGQHTFTGDDNLTFPMGYGANQTNIVAYKEIDGNNYFQATEFAFWNDHLSHEEDHVLYLAFLRRTFDYPRKIKRSGIISGPARINLRDRDHATGSYPSRSSHGMPDFNGRYGTKFDDRSSIDFLSNYAEASIRFGSAPRLSTSLHLTGANDVSGQRRRFEFVASGPEPWTSLATYTTVPLRLDTETRLSSGSFTSRLAGAINAARIGLQAGTVNDSTISLRQHVPFTGSFEQGNRIRVTNPAIRSERLDVAISQFSVSSFDGTSYPNLLPSSSLWCDTGIFTPHENSDIITAGRSVRGISDSHVSFTPGQDLLPFVESRLDIDESRSFYSEGTPDNVLPGFSARLSSKDSFVIDINPTTEHEVYFSTGSAAVRTHPGISYFNFASKQWKELGEGWTTSNQSALVDYCSNDLSIATGSYLAFTPSPYWGLPWIVNRNMRSPANGGGSNETKDASLNSIGKPTSFAGFPLASKFDPREDETLSLKDYINGPFLLEKIVIEVSGILGTYPAQSGSAVVDYNTGHGNQFFVMLQKNAEIKQNIESLIEYADGSPISIKNSKTIFEQKKIRSIAVSANAVSFPINIEDVNYQNSDDFISTKFKNAYDSAFPVSLSNFNDIRQGSVTASNFHTGTIKIEKLVSTFPVSARSVISSYTRDSTPSSPGENRDNNFIQIFGEALGGRNLFDVSNGNSYIKSIAGANVEKQIQQIGINNIGINKYDNQENTSPVLLFPEDQIIIGVANQPLPTFSNVSDSTFTVDLARNESAIATIFRTKLSPGIGKVTFYGSYLRDSQPLPPETSQSLTSDAIHEDVRDDSNPHGEARCMDQFLVEPTLSYSGSYLDTKIYDVYNSSLGIISISAGLDHTLALTLDGKVYSLGQNFVGQLGLGYFQQNGQPSVTEWQLISFFSDRNIQIKQITAGANCSFAIDIDGNGWSWGLNQNLQLGLDDASTSSKYFLPQLISKCEYTYRLDSQPLIVKNFVPKFSKISTRSNQVIALITNPPDDIELTKNFTEADKNYFYTNIVFWGKDVGDFDFRYLDNLSDENRKCPLVVPFARPEKIVEVNKTFETIPYKKYFVGWSPSRDDRTTFADVSCGLEHSLCLTKIKNGNRLFAFGSGNNGQLGQGNLDEYTAQFVEVTGSASSSFSDADCFISSIASSNYANFAVVSSAVASPFFVAVFNTDVYSWGLNSKGVLGQDISSEAFKQTTPTLLNTSSIPFFSGALYQRKFAQVYAGSNHAIASLPYKNQFGYILDDTKKDYVYSWGNNVSGQLGIGQTGSFQNKPVLAKEFDNTEIQISNAFAASNFNSFFVRRNEGQYYAAGSEFLGLEGINQTNEFTKSNLLVAAERVFLHGSILGGDVPSSQGSVNRFARHVNESETYYDSHVPGIDDVLRAANAQRTQTETADATVLVDTIKLYLPPAAPDPAQHTERVNWLFSFPFQSEFDGIKRSATIDDINKSSSENPTAIDAVIVSGSFGLDYDKVYLETLRNGGPFPDSPYITPLSFLIKPETLSKLFYGFGDFGSKLALNSDVLRDGNGMPPNYGRTPGDFYYIREDADPERVVLPRGFKYGLINAVPLPRSAVFRGDHYGQFRDMLEQGQDTHFFEGVVRFAGRPSRYLGEPAVKLRFIARDGDVADPQSTNSQNLSPFATSSLPYFDGNAVDRTDVPPDEQPRFVLNAVNFVPQVFSIS